MQTSQKLFLAFVAIAGTLAAQTPSFTGIVNAASSIPPGFPNYAIAQGSIFLIYGSNLSNAPASGSIYTAATLPLPTTAGLTGTVITITVGSTTVTAPILFTLATQIGAVLPSSTPVGTATLTLTYNGKSASTPITVLASAFGISNSASGAGNSVAALVFGTNQNEFVTQTDAAAAGDIVVLYGTGLGPVNAGQTDTSLPLAGNVGSAPTVFVGGVAAASVAYDGRSPCRVGLDEIAFTIPTGVPTGCQVSIIVQTSNGTVPIESNGPTTAIAATHHTSCTDPVDFVPPSLLSSTTNTKALAVSLKQQIQVNSNGGSSTTSTTTAKAQSFVLQFTPAQLATLAFTNVESSEGSCFTGITLSSSNGGGPPVATYLNAGSSVTLTPPSGNGAPIALPSVGTGEYQNTTVTSIPSGTWGYANSGGSDVAALTFSFPVPQPIVWTNETALLNTTVTRANGLTITWTGGDQNGYVDIQGYAQNTSGTYQVGFDCSAPVTAQTFTIPPSILLAFPTGAGAQSGIQVSTYALPFTLPAISGFTAGLNLAELQTSIPIIYK